MIDKKSKSVSVVLSVMLMIVLNACSAGVVDKTPRQAVLIESSEENTQTISQAMSKALNGKKITLAPNAFLKSAQHTLEKKSFSGINENPIDGLILGLPVTHRFTLILKDSSCYLAYMKTGKSFPLNGVSCTAL